MEFETLAIHAGQDPDPVTGSVVTPIYATSTYAQQSPGEQGGYEYSRTANPTRTALETALTVLEGVDPAKGGCVATASGMAAAALCGYLLRPGDRVLLPNDVYGGTFRFFAGVLGDQGIAWSAVDMTDLEAVEAAVESLIEVPAAMTHLSVSDTAIAVAEDLVRLSVGIEAADDLIRDLDQAIGILSSHTSRSRA